MVNLPREIVLYSSGWESTGCVFKAGPDAPLVFFDYGQSYLKAEAVKAQRFAVAFDRELVVVSSKSIIEQMGNRLPSGTVLDETNRRIVVPDRNLLMLRAVHHWGARLVWFGTKGIHPLFDSYGDSNWATLKREGRRLGVDVRLPWTMIPKFWVKHRVRKAIADRFVFCSEGIVP